MGTAIVSDHARIELEKLDEEQVLVDGYSDVVSAFERLTKSLAGDELENAITILNALFRGEHVSPLTNDPAEWKYFGHSSSEGDMWKNTRNPNAFSTDNGETYYLMARQGKKIGWRGRREYRTVPMTVEVE